MSNQELFKKANTALAEGNYFEFIACCADNIVWKNIGSHTYNGKSELLNYIRSTYTKVSFTPENIIHENDFIVELGKLVSEVNGNSKKGSYCDIWNFKDGKINQFTSFVI